jgi:hypothetical protein
MEHPRSEIRRFSTNGLARRGKVQVQAAVRRTDAEGGRRGAVASRPGSGPVEVALARSVDQIPAPSALPGGSRFEVKWDGYLY